MQPPAQSKAQSPQGSCPDRCEGDEISMRHHGPAAPTAQGCGSSMEAGGGDPHHIPITAPHHLGGTAPCC